MYVQHIALCVKEGLEGLTLHEELVLEISFECHK